MKKKWLGGLYKKTPSEAIRIQYFSLQTAIPYTSLIISGVFQGSFSSA